MAQYIFITNNLEEDAMEIPSEEDATILLSTLQAQYPSAIGLKYKVENRYRAVKLADGKLYAPLDGWQDRTYFCTFDAKSPFNPAAGNSASAAAVQSKRSYPDQSGGAVSNTDLVVLGIPWNYSDSDLKEYFEQFGPLEFANVKVDKNTGRSKGFGFIRFTSHEAAMKVMLKKHKIGNRICDVRIPESTKIGTEDPVSSKVFVGSLSPNLTEADLREFFETYGAVTEVLIPKPFREFAFVTFESDTVAKSLIGQHLTIRETQIVVMEATPKKKMNERNDWNNQNNYGDRRNDRSRSPNNGRGHYGGGGGGNYFDNRQQGGYNNKRRRNDYDDWHQGNGGAGGNSPALTPDVLQLAVSKAVSEVLNVGKSIDPWNRH